MEVALISGGLDSTILALQIPSAKRVYIDYGQEYRAEEERAVQRVFDVYEKIVVSTSTELKDIFIPNRNLTFASLVATYYNPDIIYMAGLRDDYVVDKTPEAFRRMSAIISDFCQKEVKVISPFWHLTKGEIVEQFLKQGGDPAILNNTYSCYKGVRGGCGDCPACFRHFVALESNGIPQIKPTWRITKEYLKKLHRYDSNRIARTLIALSHFYKIAAFDIDGVLCEEAGPYEERKPMPDEIDKVNNFEGIVILFTSRLESDREATEKWLAANNVHYHSLIMEKIPYHSLIDDRAWAYEI